MKYLRLIKTIAEEGNIARSSGKLFLTQSALSHQLKELENQLEFPVFARSRNRWQLTEEGEELYRVACQVISRIEKGFNTISQIRSGSTGSIKLSTECYTFYQNLPAFIQKMGLLYPNINVELNLEATHYPIQKVTTKELDMALVTSLPSDPSLLATPIGKDEIYAVLHREHPLSEKPYLMASDFSTLDLIIHSYPLETVSVFKHFLYPNAIQPLSITAIPLTEVALEMVRANMGVTCLPKWALSTFQSFPEIKQVRIGEKGLIRTHYLVIRKADQDKKYIRDFSQNFETHFNDFSL